MEKPHLFFISGLGADHRAFDRIRLDGYEQTHLPWIIPEKMDTLHSYARKMAEPITETRHPVVIGVSLGGMLASEMTTFIPHLRAILISSIKAPSERSLLLKAGRVLPVQHLVPVWLIKRMTFAWRWANYKRPKADVDRMLQMFHEQDDRFLKWALINAPKWKGAGISERIHHIHGDNDRMFPLRQISDPTIVKKGTHIMVYSRGAEVARLIKEELNRIGDA